MCTHFDMYASVRLFPEVLPPKQHDNNNRGTTEQQETTAHNSDYDNIQLPKVLPDSLAKIEKAEDPGWGG